MLNTKNRTKFADVMMQKVHDDAHKLCDKLHPTLSSPFISSIDQKQFNFQFQQFTQDLPIATQVKDNLKYLYELFDRFRAVGGLIEALATNKMNKIIKDLSLRFPDISSLTVQNIYQHYVKFELFSFETALKLGKRILTQKLVCLKVPQIYNSTQVMEIFSNGAQKSNIFHQDITLLDEFCNISKITKQNFTIQKLIQRYGTQKLKIKLQQVNMRDLIQEQNSRNKTICQKIQNCCSNLSLSNCKKIISQSSSPKNQSQLRPFIEINLTDYFDYFKLNGVRQKISYVQNKFSFAGKDQILACCRFDPQDDYFIEEIHEKMHETIFGFKQNNDLLSYADEDISGVTLPIFQFQVQGNWTGAHQQPFGLVLVDVNFGPDPVEWFCTSAQYENKINSLIKTQHLLNYDKIEGLWFEEIDWFIEKNLQVKKIVQKKGQAVILGCGAVYWKKSQGKSLHILWNLFPKIEKQITTAVNKLSRYNLASYQPQYCASSLKIPLKSMFLRILNHEQYKVGQSRPKKEQQLSPTSIVIIRDILKKCILEEQKNLYTLTIRNDITGYELKNYYLFDSESFCNFCGNQILNYFMNNDGLSCLECTYKHFIAKRLGLKDKRVYYKYDQFWMNQLVYFGMDRPKIEQDYCQQYKQLCKGEFIGVISKCRQNCLVHQEIINSQQQYNKSIKFYSENHISKEQTQHLLAVTKILSSKFQTDSLMDIEIHKEVEIQTGILGMHTIQLSDEDILSTFQILKEHSQQFEDQRTQGKSQQAIKRKIKRLLMRSPSSDKSETNYTNVVESVKKEEDHYNSRKNYTKQKSETSAIKSYYYPSSPKKSNQRQRKNTYSTSYRKKDDKYQRNNEHGYHKNPSNQYDRKDKQKNSRDFSSPYESNRHKKMDQRSRERKGH